MKINLYVTAACAALAYVFVGTVGYKLGVDHGITDGLDKFHEACYTGGVVINEKTGKAIQCGPLGIVPKEELPEFFKQPLDKDSKTV